MRKHGLRAIGLSLMAALSLMAFGATAQAATPEWQVLLSQLVNNAEVNATLKSASALLTSTIGIASTPIIIHCTALTVDDGLIFGSGHATTPNTSLGELLFSNCKTLLFEGGAFKESTNCKPLESILAKVRNKIILHGGRTYILFEPHTGETFTEIEFHAPCALPLKTPIKGEIIVECLAQGGGAADCAQDTVHHLIAPADTTLFSGTNGLPKSQGLLFGNKAATLEGEADLFLIGAVEGCTWAAI